VDIRQDILAQEKKEEQGAFVAGSRLAVDRSRPKPKQLALVNRRCCCMDNVAVYNH
jgi:hypothetical protein